MRISTQVSKAHPAIKKLLAATVGKDWRGRLVSVVQVDPSWTFRLYNDVGEPAVWKLSYVDQPRPYVEQLSRPTYGAPATLVDAPSRGEAVVTKNTGAAGSVTIYVHALDQADLDVARDAVAEGNKKLADQVLKQIGPYAGIADAIVRSQSSTIEKVTSGKTSRQLTREIDEFMKTRG